MNIRNFVWIFGIFLIIFISGCTSQDLTPVVKAVPEVQQFLKEHPDATIRAVYWDESTVEANINEIRDYCGEQIQVKPYYKVDVVSSDFTLVGYVDASSETMTCSVIKGKGTAEGETLNCPALRIHEAYFTPGFNPGERGGVIVKILNADADKKQTGFKITVIYPDGISTEDRPIDVIYPLETVTAGTGILRQDSNTTAPSRIEITTNECPETPIAAIVEVREQPPRREKPSPTLSCPALSIENVYYDSTTRKISVALRNKATTISQTGIKLIVLYTTPPSAEFVLDDLAPSNIVVYTVNITETDRYPVRVEVISAECPTTQLIAIIP